MDEHGRWANSSYQLSLDNFVEAGQKLSGLELVIGEIIAKSDIGYDVNEVDIHVGYYITSNYDAENIISRLLAMDELQLGYIHHSLSEKLRHDELELVSSNFLSAQPKSRIHQAKHKVYTKIQDTKFEKPLIIIDFDFDIEYSLKKSSEGGVARYHLEAQKETAPFEDRYIEKGKARAVNHYYSFSEADESRREADLCWNILNAKIGAP